MLPDEPDHAAWRRLALWLGGCLLFGLLAPLMLSAAVLGLLQAQALSWHRAGRPARGLQFMAFVRAGGRVAMAALIAQTLALALLFASLPEGVSQADEPPALPAVPTHLVWLTLEASFILTGVLGYMCLQRSRERR
jgi:hypothetical protein